MVRGKKEASMQLNGAMQLVLVLSTVLVIYLILRLYFYLEKARQTRMWPTVTGQILRSTVRRCISKSTDSEGDTVIRHYYEPDISYEYHVNGQRYSSTAWGFGGISRLAGQQFCQSIASQYSPGQSVPVHINPKRPQEAVLAAGRTAWLISVTAPTSKARLKMILPFTFVVIVVAVAVLSFLHGGSSR